MNYTAKRFPYCQFSKKLSVYVYMLEPFLCFVHYTVYSIM